MKCFSTGSNFRGFLSSARQISAAAREADFFGDRPGGGAGIFGGGDRPADDQVAGTRTNGLGGRGHPRLVVQRRVCRPHSRHHNQEFRPAGPAYRLCLLRGGDHAVKPSLFCQQRKSDYAGRGRAGNTDAPEGRFVHARQYRNAQQRGGLFLTGQGFARGTHHGEPAQRMDVDQAHLGEVRSGGHGAGHRVGNIVKLEIEEDFEAQARDFFDRSRAFRCEELQANLEQARRTAKATRQGAGRPQAVKVQGYD
jgi:hypothetical protein